MAGGGVGEAALLETVIASEAAGYAAGAELLGTALPAGGIAALTGAGALGAGALGAGATGAGLAGGLGSLSNLTPLLEGEFGTAALNPAVAAQTAQAANVAGQAIPSGLEATNFAQPGAVQPTNIAQMMGNQGVNVAGGTPQAAVQAAADAASAVDPNAAMSEALRTNPSLTMGPANPYPTPGSVNLNDAFAKALAQAPDLTQGGKNAEPGVLDQLGKLYDKIPTAAKYGLGALGAVKGLNYLEGNKYGTPEKETYTGPLSRFKYDPSRYTPTIATPNVYRPAYAGGGPVEAMSNANSIGANTGYPMAAINKGAYATPYQTPISRNVVTGGADTNVDPMTGEMKLAGGGLSDLGSYADYAGGGRMLKGPGDGMSDSIPATIAGKQPARLANDEFVVPADVVSHLGNGSSDAGAKQLYRMMDKVRAARTGKKSQAKQINPDKYMPA